jgi:hypothetical protein
MPERLKKSRGVSAFACAIHTANYCLILLGPTVWDNEGILRHEIGHCNGWPQDHRGERSTETPKTIATDYEQN